MIIMMINNSEKVTIEFIIEIQQSFLRKFYHSISLVEFYFQAFLDFFCNK